MREELLYEEYTEDKKHKFMIFQHDNAFDLWIQDFDEDWQDYYDRCDGRHLIDSFENAKKLGKQLI